MTVKVGDVVALCYCGIQRAHRVRNVTVTKVKKTFIEIEDGTRFSVGKFNQTRGTNGTQTCSSYYLDPVVSYWDNKALRDAAMRELNTGFENLISAARNRNWEEVKSCYAALSSLIGE
jgi:hypothetical protein